MSGISRCNATIAWERARNIGKKDKLNESENKDHYSKSSHQKIKQLKQNKQQSKKNDLSDSQEGQRIVLGDTSFELDSVHPENLKNGNLILSKCYRMGKKVQDQMCLLINNNWWFSWAYKKTKNIANNVITDLATI
ncbi:unnamed protein product [Rhizophagus irregularis]|nr:unnamed protein product [Rhizophagus irregularis]